MEYPADDKHDQVATLLSVVCDAIAVEPGRPAPVEAILIEPCGAPVVRFVGFDRTPVSVPLDARPSEIAAAIARLDTDSAECAAAQQDRGAWLGALHRLARDGHRLRAGASPARIVGVSQFERELSVEFEGEGLGGWFTTPLQSPTDGLVERMNEEIAKRSKPVILYTSAPPEARSATVGARTPAVL